MARPNYRALCIGLSEFGTLSGASEDEEPSEAAEDFREHLVFAEQAAGRQGVSTALVRHAANRVAHRYGLDQELTRKFVTRFFGEVNTYFVDPARRDQVIGDVAARIAEATPRVIIAHSLGSVVAYETLWSRPHPAVDLLLTMGSPLALPDVVFDRLEPHDGPRGIPPGVHRWINVTDPGDLVAIPVGGIGARFTGVTADLTDAIHAFKFHQVAEYLSCRTTAGVLSAQLSPSISS
jgi:hypothetical protein